MILAAGQGVRMRSTLAKVLHPVAGQPMIGHVFDTVRWLSPARTIAVLAPGADAVAAAVPKATPIIQTEPKGTGDAVLRARDALAGFDGEVLIIFGDTPLATAETMRAMVDACRDELGIGFGETTADNKFTLIEVECLGACVNAPMMQIGADFYEDLDADSTRSVLKALGDGETPKAGSQTGRTSAENAAGLTSLTSLAGDE